jgi:hypothetical protein
VLFRSGGYTKVLPIIQSKELLALLQTPIPHCRGKVHGNVYYRTLINTHTHNVSTFDYSTSAESHSFYDMCSVLVQLQLTLVNRLSGSERLAILLDKDGEGSGGLCTDAQTLVETEERLRSRGAAETQEVLTVDEVELFFKYALLFASLDAFREFDLNVPVLHRDIQNKIIHLLTQISSLAVQISCGDKARIHPATLLTHVYLEETGDNTGNLWVHGKKTELRGNHYRLMLPLLNLASEPVSYLALYQALYPESVEDDVSAVRGSVQTSIARLRQELENHGTNPIFTIKNVQGEGYQLRITV